jgi:hypothetical protein
MMTKVQDTNVTKDRHHGPIQVREFLTNEAYQLQSDF